VRVIREDAIVASFVGVEVFDGHPESRPQHPAGVSVEERPEAADIAFPGLSDPAADRGLHEMLRIVDQQFGDAECVVELTFPDERPGGGYRGPAFPPVG
jgi:hypothetical protein